MKQVRLTKENEEFLDRIVEDAKNDLLTVSGAANICIQKGRAQVRKLFVKPKRKPIPKVGPVK